MKSITDPASLALLLSRLERLQVDTSPRWGRMTAAQLVCHLHDVTQGVLANPGRGTGRARPLRKLVGLYLPVPWPKGVRAPANVDAEKGGTPPEDFARDRDRAAQALRDLSAAGPEDWPGVHPVFGKLSPREWGVWSYRHTAHHLRQFGL